MKWQKISSKDFNYIIRDGKPIYVGYAGHNRYTRKYMLEILKKQLTPEQFNKLDTQVIMDGYASFTKVGLPLVQMGVNVDFVRGLLGLSWDYAREEWGWIRLGQRPDEFSNYNYSKNFVTPYGKEPINAEIEHLTSSTLSNLDKALNELGLQLNQTINIEVRSTNNVYKAIPFILIQDHNPSAIVDYVKDREEQYASTNNWYKTAEAQLNRLLYLKDGETHVCEFTLDKCKKCGWIPSRKKYLMPRYKKQNKQWLVECPSCKTTTPLCDSFSGAMVEWNSIQRGNK